MGVFHVLSAIKPESLQSRLDSDLAISLHHLPKDITGFMKHSIDIADAFQKVDTGAPNLNDRSNLKSRRTRKGRSVNKDDAINNAGEIKNENKQDKNLPLCLYGPHRFKGYRHLLRNCTSCPEDEKKSLLKAHAEEKAQTGPSKSRRAQKAATDTDKSNEKQVGRLRPVKPSTKSSSFPSPFRMANGPFVHWPYRRWQ